MLKCTSHAAKLKARLLNIWKWSFNTSKNNISNWKRKKIHDIGEKMFIKLQAVYSILCSSCILWLYFV